MNPRTVHLALRGTMTALAVLAAVQVLLAGSFLSGHYPVLRWHMITGFAMVVVALVQSAVIFLPGRRQREPSLPRMGLLIPVLLATQGILGVFRVLELHVPIGVLMAVGTVHAATWAWKTPLPGAQPAAAAKVEVAA
ncbi:MULTISPECIES: hypothetical protein [Dactylosporangium]|nr:MULTISPECIES: hypothetical protein [Dactylosporangium]UAB99346.1 hypothetical protein Dvina_15445 [Dactylosporangium vinaceum]UWZ47575.1 hypothetical protein Dmats_14885 [Dactylosporangium matsuzakiense]